MLKTYQDTQVALGCEVHLTIVSDASQVVSDKYFYKLWMTIFNFEKRCSRFLPASELTQFNKAAGARQPITQEFRDVLLAAKRMADESEGLYNPFILPALQRTGYIKSMVAKYSNDYSDDFSDRAVVPADRLLIGDTWANIPYGTAIDLGGCGKGYIGDRLADIASTFPEINGYWFSLGGDVVTGGLDEHEKPWQVQVESAWGDESQSAGTIILPNPERYAVATSTPIRRAPKIGKEYTHIIDPRTNKPVESNVILSTVCARSALVADVMASSLVITGKAGVKEYLDSKHDVVSALLQTDDSKIHKFGGLIRW